MEEKGKHIAKKIITRLNSIYKEFIGDIIFFSGKLAIVRLLSSICIMLRFKNVANIFLNKKNHIVINYLKNNYFEELVHVIQEDRTKKNPVTNLYPNTIWVCWLDGEQMAPDLVKRCIQSIKEHGKKYNVVVITWDNLCNYLSIPGYILSRVKKKEMGLAHFADYIRVALLYQYGGLWLDATIFCAKNIPDTYLNCEFFTCKKLCLTPGCVSNNRWTTFCLGGICNNILYEYLQRFFEIYWYKERKAIDYLFFDDVIALLYNELSEIKKMIDEVPLNNEARDLLITYFSEEYEAFESNEFFSSNTILYKLGYREEQYLQLKTKNGKETVYSAFICNKF